MKNRSLEQVIEKTIKGISIAAIVFVIGGEKVEKDVQQIKVEKNEIQNVITNEFLSEVEREIDAIYFMPYKKFVLENMFRDIIFKYDFFIRNASEKYKIDEETIIALIAKESKGELNAVSHKGAAGLMQLMKYTARDLGLRVDNYVDERMSMKAIDAGVRYLAWLKNFYSEYASNHMLALIAYNFGVGATDRLFYKMRACFEPSMAWQRLKKFLPEESERYVIDIFAWKKIIKEIKENEEIQPMSYAIRKTRRWANRKFLRYLAKKYGVRAGEIKKFNPHIKKWHAIPPKTEIYIPLR